MITQKIILILKVLTIVSILPSCTSLIKCEYIEESHSFLLLDVSDKKLFKVIENDLTDNFPDFMQRTRLGSISPCKSFTLSIANFSGYESLDISSKTIAINRKGLSREEEKRLANPKPLVKLMRDRIDDYRHLTDDPEITSSTNIANVLVKSINQANTEADNLFLLFTDGIENNVHLNLYSRIPMGKDIPQLIGKLIEATVLNKFHQLQGQGLQAKIVMVLKSDPTGKVDQRAIKSFWKEVFEELELPYQFIDNLSNHVEL